MLVHFSHRCPLARSITIVTDHGGDIGTSDLALSVCGVQTVVSQPRMRRAADQPQRNSSDRSTQTGQGSILAEAHIRTYTFTVSETLIGLADTKSITVDLTHQSPPSLRHHL